MGRKARFKNFPSNSWEELRSSGGLEDTVVRVAGRGTSPLTWCGQSILVLGSVFRDSLQHHPHGEGEHGREEAIEDEVEEEDEG